MKQKTWIFLLCAILFIVGAAGSIYILTKPVGTQVEIVRDGEVLCRLDLEKEEDQILEFSYEGRVNRIEIKDHKIHMLEADCPDQICVNMGWLDSAAPVVCLPNHLLIRFVQQSEELDAVAV